VALPLFGHHASGPSFDQTKTVLIVGKLVKFDWVNPHGYVHLEVTDVAGKKVVWRTEIGPPNRLIQLGWTRDGALGLVGQNATIKGHPLRDGSQSLQLILLTTEKGAVMSPGTPRTENGSTFLDGIKIRVENGVVVAVPN
jgi:hypothetical protein